MASLITTGVDLVVFSCVHNLSSSIFLSTYASRSVALLVNFSLVRRFVFRSPERLIVRFIQYVILVCILGAMSALLVTLARGAIGMHVLPAKCLVESLLYAGNFLVQRDVIFGFRRQGTDWDRYYDKPYKTSGFARRLVGRKLASRIKHYVPDSQKSMAEFGGANSCFYEGICREVSFRCYHIVDSNRTGLERFAVKHFPPDRVRLHLADVLKDAVDIVVDVVFSVGLIEHFKGKDVERVIQAHFRALRPGGILVLSFPTPTLLYELTRFFAEQLGLWIFHDETPLRLEDIRPTLEQQGDILEHHVIWRMFLTQCMAVIRKRPHADTT